jgi:hypothetical protein
LNFLLSLNKKLFLIFTFFVFFFIFVLLIIVYYKSNSIPKNIVNISKNNADITQPKFSINSDKQNISVTAKEGNFLTEDEIKLEKNVIFKSKKFKIYSDNVVFNKKSLIASSTNKSKFISEKASIDSIGFDIIENGNIINFKGKTRLVLK